MTWPHAILICCVVLLALWRRPPTVINVYIDRDLCDGDDGEGEEIVVERIPVERTERNDATFN